MTVKTATLAVVLCSLALGAVAEDLPSRVGTCAATSITRLEQRLRDGPNGPFMAGSGSAVGYANGGYQVSYDEVAGVQRARVGDPVLLCLIRLPQGCPPGDRRGRWYTTTDLRTMESWTMPDAEHGCGGA